MTGERVERLRRNHPDEVDSAACTWRWRPRSATSASRASTAAWRRPSRDTPLGGTSSSSSTPARPGRRARILAWLAGHFGASLLLPTLATREQLDRRGVIRSGSRQLAIGLAAAAVTFGIGRLVGVEIV